METNDYQKDIRDACRRERQFHDKKDKQLRKVHDVLDNPEYSEDEKYVILTTELKYGKQRAQELCYGRRRTEWKN